MFVTTQKFTKKMHFACMTFTNGAQQILQKYQTLLMIKKTGLKTGNTNNDVFLFLLNSKSIPNLLVKHEIFTFNKTFKFCVDLNKHLTDIIKINKNKYVKNCMFLKLM